MTAAVKLAGLYNLPIERPERDEAHKFCIDVLKQSLKPMEAKNFAGLCMHMHMPRGMSSIRIWDLGNGIELSIFDGFGARCDKYTYEVLVRRDWEPLGHMTVHEIEALVKWIRGRDTWDEKEYLKFRKRDEEHQKSLVIQAKLLLGEPAHVWRV